MPEWNEIVTSFGRAMNVGEISDLKVTPRDALAAFERRSRQFDPVFKLKVQTNDGRDIAAKYRTDRNADAIYLDLVKLYT